MARRALLLPLLVATALTLPLASAATRVQQEGYLGWGDAWTSDGHFGCENPRNVGGACFSLAKFPLLDVLANDDRGNPTRFHVQFLNAGGGRLPGPVFGCGSLQGVAVPPDAVRVEVVVHLPSTADCPPGSPTVGRPPVSPLGVIRITERTA